MEGTWRAHGWHLEAHGILAQEQWGFRPHRSSTDAVLVMARVMADYSRCWEWLKQNAFSFTL